MGGSLNSLAPIFTPYPVDPDHPLNQGLRAWWLAIPDLYGGRQLFDLCDRNHFGLTNFNWANSYRMGGMGQIAGNGTNSTGVLSGVSEFNWDYTQPFSVSFWVNFTVGNLYHTIYSTLDPANNYRGWEVATTSNAIEGMVLYLISTYPSDTINVYCGWPPLGTWQHVVFTWDGSGVVGGVAYYLNGIQGTWTSYPSTSGSVVGAMANSVPLRIGSRTDVSDVLNGAVDDLRIYNRKLGPDEPAALNREGLGGYPETLNRIMPRAVRVAPPVFPPWNADVMLSGAPFGGSLL